MKACCLVTDMAPYHEARFNAAAEAGDLLVLDVGKDIETAYDPPESVRFPIIKVEQAAMEAKLTEIRPDVLVVPGWGSVIAQRALLWAMRHDCPLVTFSDSQLEGLPRSVLTGLGETPACFGRSLPRMVAGARARRYLQHFGLPSAAISEGVDVVDNAHFAQHAGLSAIDLSEARARLACPSATCFRSTASSRKRI